MPPGMPNFNKPILPPEATAPKEVPRPRPKLKLVEQTPAPKPKKEDAIVELDESDLEEIVDEVDEADILEITPDVPKTPEKAPRKPPPLPVRKTQELVPADEVFERREPGELQSKDVVPALDVEGFKGLKVAVTMEKKDERKLGRENPGKNEDTVLTDQETGLMGVLDGLGGMKAKAESASDASSRAEAMIPETYKNHLSRLKNVPIGEVAKTLVDQQINRAGYKDPMLRLDLQKKLAIQAESVIAKDPSLGRRALALVESFKDINASIKETGGKTTACIGFIHQAPDGTRWAVVANVGDSAAFKRGKDGRMMALTKEDSAASVVENSGAVDKETLNKMKASINENFPVPFSKEPMSYADLKRGMTHALGSSNPESAEPTLTIHPIEPGEEIIFASDGIVDFFEKKKKVKKTDADGKLTEVEEETGETDLEDLSKHIGGAGSLTERMDHLRQETKKRETPTKKDDDISMVVAKAI